MDGSRAELALSHSYVQNVKVQGIVTPNRLCRRHGTLIGHDLSGRSDRWV